MKPPSLRGILLSLSPRGTSGVTAGQEGSQGREKACDEASRTLKVVAPLASLAVAVFGVLGVVGWTFGISALEGAYHGLPAMVPNTALGFLLAGFSLWVLRPETVGGTARVLGRAAAGVVALLGALTLCEYCFGWDLGIDRIAFKEALAGLKTPIPGRPAVLTAANFLLLGLALLLLDTNSRHGQRLVEVLTVTALLISFLALIGYICNVPLFYGWRSLFPGTAVALAPLLASTALGVGLLCTRPDRGLMELLTSDTAGGLMARRLLLAPVLIPLGTGWLKQVGQSVGIYNPEFAGWLFAFLNIFVFTIIIWWNAGLLFKADKVRRRAETDLQKLNTNLEQRVGERTAELSQAMRALQENEERVRLVVDTSLDAVVTIDDCGTVTSWSREAERIFGWTRREIIGKRLSETIIPKQYREAHERGLNHFRATHSGKVLNQRIEITALNRDGREFPVELAITPIRLGDTFMFSAFVRDITERKRAEEKIQTLNATLEQHVAERTAQLELANKELEAFSYSVSHDLRAPLRHIGGFVEMLRAELHSVLQDNSQRYLEIIADAARQMEALIEDLLEFSRTGRAEMRCALVHTAGLVEEVLRELKPEFRDRTIAWDIAELPEVFGDHPLLKQVWFNLLSNAIKYTRLRQRAEIRIGCVLGQGEVEFVVRDNGAGFDMKYADKLFGVFQRLHLPEEFEGTGIGLANVRRIVLRHGGRTWAEGEVDVGATFHFTLPIKLKGEKDE